MAGSAAPTNYSWPSRPVSAPPGGRSSAAANATSPTGPGKTGSGWGDLANDSAHPRWMSEYYAGRRYRDSGFDPDGEPTDDDALVGSLDSGMTRRTVLKVPRGGPSFGSTNHLRPERPKDAKFTMKTYDASDLSVINKPSGGETARTAGGGAVENWVPEQMRRHILRRLRDLEAENGVEKRRLLMLKAENEELRSLQHTAHFGNARCLRAEAAEARVERLRQETQGLEERLRQAKQARNKMRAQQRE